MRPQLCQQTTPSDGTFSTIYKRRIQKKLAEEPKLEEATQNPVCVLKSRKLIFYSVAGLQKTS